MRTPCSLVQLACGPRSSAPHGAQRTRTCSTVAVPILKWKKRGPEGQVLEPGQKSPSLSGL